MRFESLKEKVGDFKISGANLEDEVVSLKRLRECGIEENFSENQNIRPFLCYLERAQLVTFQWSHDEPRRAAAPGIFTKLMGFCFKPQTSNRPGAAQIKTFLYVCINAKLRPTKATFVASITIFHSLQVGPEYKLPWTSGKKPSEGWREANMSAPTLNFWATAVLN